MHFYDKIFNLFFLKMRLTATKVLNKNQSILLTTKLNIKANSYILSTK